MSGCWLWSAFEFSDVPHRVPISCRLRVPPVESRRMRNPVGRATAQQRIVLQLSAGALAGVSLSAVAGHGRSGPLRPNELLAARDLLQAQGLLFLREKATDGDRQLAI